jgi:hypothetical protein
MMKKPVFRRRGAAPLSSAAWLCFAFAIIVAAPALAQAPLPTPPKPPESPSPPPSYPPAELDRIVSPIALYPDPLLAQVLAAATFPQDVPDAARWADDHHYLTGKVLTDAIAADRVPWDPSVQALLPFPSVLETMASDMPWTQELGDAFLADPAAVMDAVQRMRHKAYGYGYLQSCAPMVVRGGPYVEILPANPAFIVVPYYDPAIVFVPPPPTFVPARAIYCGFAIRLGIWFGPWGWGTTRMGWATHTVIINNAPWRRTWANRGAYAHPSAVPRYATPRPPEQHPVRPRTPTERARERPKDGSHERGRGST